MLTYSELKELSALSGEENHFVSLYLNVNPITNPRGDYLIHYRNMLKETLDSLGKENGKTLKKDFDKIERFLEDNKRSFNKGVAIISSGSNDFWRSYHLSLPVKNDIIVDSTPYIKPLLAILDNYQRYAVLMADKGSARIFVIYLGEIEEYTEFFTHDIPGKHKKGGWYSLQQSRFERHIEYHVDLHIKEVVKRFEGFLNKEDINRIIIGGTEETVVKIRKALPQSVLKKVIARLPAKMITEANDILKMTLKITDEYEKEEEMQTVDELIKRTLKNESAVIGAEDVLAYLQEGRVKKLVFLKDKKMSGFKCNNCNYLTVQSISSCPYCRDTFSEIKYLVDFIAQKAVEQDVAIKVISENTEFTEKGGIGAFLRF